MDYTFEGNAQGVEELNTLPVSLNRFMSCNEWVKISISIQYFTFLSVQVTCLFQMSSGVWL